MKKNNTVYLRQIIDYVEEIEKYVEKVSFHEFEKNGMLQDAVIRKIELIGEAARRLSPLFWEKYRKVLPLAYAVSTRNKLIHEYDDIDLKIVWDTIKKDLLKLKKKIEEII
jgi:uncharacterized protein with HEPN domain